MSKAKYTIGKLIDTDSGGDFINTIYNRILWLAAAAHLIYEIMFLFLRVPPVVLYNIFSVLFYAFMHLATKRRLYKAILLAVHLEICFFTSFMVLLVGWDYGFQYLLICLASLTYFCPYKNKYVPYIYSIAEMVLFVALKIVTIQQPSVYQNLAQPLYVHLFFIYNSCLSFLLIVVASILCNISTTLKRSELIEKNRDLDRLASHDPLTNLLNRRSMTERLQKALELCETSGIPFYVIIGDIDDFKKINDTYGHDCGDLVLRQIAQILSSCFRSADAVCRWGGEEFLILLADVSKPNALSIVERLRTAIGSTPMVYRNTPIHITMTFGMDTFEAGDKLDEIIKRADKCLYDGKRQGKNCVVCR